MAVRLTQPIKEFFAHHRKFTPFQKVLISSIFVGVLLCVLRSWWFLLVSCTYTVTVYASVTVTKYIITCQLYFPSDVILAFYENIAGIIRNLLYGPHEGNLQPKNKDDKADSTGRSEEKYDLQMHTKETDDDQFYDTYDSTEFLNSSKINHTVHNCTTMPQRGPCTILEEEDTGLYCERTATCVPTAGNKISLEINNIIKLIQKDFIESWYKLFSKEQSVLTESEIIFHHIVHALQGRLYRANTRKLFEFILLMFKDHVRFVKEAQGMFKVQSKSRRRRSPAKTLNQAEMLHPSPSKIKIVYKSVEDCYGTKVELHPAVTNTEIEHAYQKSIIELLLIYLLREDLHESEALVCALKEILTFNVLQKVMDLVSNTTFLHERIIKITSDEDIFAGVEGIPTITVSESESLTNNVQSILTQRKNIRSDSIPQTDTGLSEESPQNELKHEQKVDETSQKDLNVVKWKEDTEIHPVSSGLCNECNRLCSVDKERISPRPHTCSLGNTPTFFDVNVDPDRSSLQSFASISSNSSVEEGATFTVGEQLPVDTDNTQPVRSIEKDSDSLDKMEKNRTISSKDQSPTKLSAPVKTIETPASVEVHAGGKSPESPSHMENKPSSNIFPSLKFPFGNPLSSLPSFRKPSFKSLSPTTETPSISTAGTEQSKSDIIKRSHSQGDVIPMSDENPWPLNTPSVFQKVKIASTEKAREAGSFGEYTLYNIEFEALYQSDNGELVNKTGVVRRRFREFINLQSRLEDNTMYKKILKDVKGPKRVLPSLPFGNMGKDTVDSRKELLESFLLALIGKEDICNTEEVKQFLGYSGDGHIAFVRKPPENTGPRIDQRLVKTMSGVFDKIVEGLPSLPQQLPRIISPFDSREEKEDLSDEKLTDDADDIDLSFNDDVDKVLKQKVESTFERFVEQQSLCVLDDDTEIDTTLGTSVLSWQDQQVQGTSSSHMTSTRHMTDGHGHMTQTAKNKKHTNVLSHLGDTDNPLSDAVLSILTEALQRQDHWVCRENVVKAAKVLVGKGLNRFVEEKVDFLTSTEMNIFYLKTLRETIWPHGELSTEQAFPYTDLQTEQIKQQATRCLAEFLPGILSVVLGAEEFDQALEELIEALKYEKLNRHFWYTVFDVVLEELFPEVNTQDLQRKLSAVVQQ